MEKLFNNNYFQFLTNENKLMALMKSTCRTYEMASKSTSGLDNVTLLADDTLVIRKTASCCFKVYYKQNLSKRK